MTYRIDPCMWVVAKYPPATMLRRPLSLALLALLAAEMPDAAQAFAPSSLRAFGAAKAQLPAVPGPRGNVRSSPGASFCVIAAGGWPGARRSRGTWWRAARRGRGGPAGALWTSPRCCAARQAAVLRLCRPQRTPSREAMVRGGVGGSLPARRVFTRQGRPCSLS